MSIRSDTWRTIFSRSFLCFVFQLMFELETVVEVVFDGGFAAPGDHDDIANSGVNSLFNSVLDDGFVN